MNIPLFTTFFVVYYILGWFILLDFPPGWVFFTLARRPKGQGYGRQRASCVRDDFDSYVFCSGLAAMLPQKIHLTWKNPLRILTFFIIVFFWLKGKNHTLLLWRFFQFFRTTHLKIPFSTRRTRFILDGLVQVSATRAPMPMVHHLQLKSLCLLASSTSKVPGRFLSCTRSISSMDFVFHISEACIFKKKNEVIFGNCHSLCLISFVVVFVCFLY